MNYKYLEYISQRTVSFCVGINSPAGYGINVDDVKIINGDNDCAQPDINR